MSPDLNSLWRSSRILPITYQSQETTFTEWIALLTLGLAPLVAHIVAGAPHPSYLCESRPKWHDRICHYNPTSILWRYAAIADRRIRARSWDKTDMAASNALFWTSKGWDGSEDMVVDSLVHCTHLPERSRVGLCSLEMIKTLIVTMQGSQAVAIFARGLGGGPGTTSNFIYHIGLDYIFFPLAFIGLARLFPGLWLTEHFAYAPCHDMTTIDVPTIRKDILRVSTDSLMGQSITTYSTHHRFWPTTIWPSKVFRAGYLLPLLGALTITIMYTVPGFGGKRVFTWTTFLVSLFYLILFTASLVTCGYYLIRGNTSTIIPCIGSVWYKAYTLIIVALAGLLIAISCVETRQTVCGKYTSMAGLAGDTEVCFTSSTRDIMRINPARLGHFGFATTNPTGGREDTGLGAGEFLVFNFTGMCLGNIDFSSARRSETLEVVDGEQFRPFDPGFYPGEENPMPGSS
ncbi:hypothetical protein F5X99DRAFT_367656 [Biscogniauxia marginata]|nr:hypothetical protein F5X99DRAFT_367656 [Biscogniauxia marginata]